MKKGTLFSMFLFCINSVLISQTNIPGGTVSGTWSLTGSPYQIEGNIQINNNTTLYIEPGVEVIFQGYYKLNVQGKLLAVGTSADSIIFTAADSVTGWAGIKFINTPDIGISEIRYCDITHAKGSTYGGALYFENYSAVHVSNCRIAKCSAGNGGAIACWSWSDPVITNNLFESNSAGSDGGAIWCMGSSWMHIYFNTIINNTANSGGGIFCYVSSPNISNNIIANNTAVNGGGIRVNNNSSPYIINNSIVNNSAENGGGLYSDLTSYPIVRNTILWGNTATMNGQQVSIPDEADPSFYYCNIQGGQVAFYLNGNSYFGTYQNNINSSPLFVSPSAGSGVSHYAGDADWSLLSTSPCIDSGDPNEIYPETDIAGDYRVSVCRIDMGALEFQKGGPLSISFSYSETFHCNGGNNGSISAVIAGGGGGPYGYLWSNGHTLQNLTITNQGVYSVTVTDSASMCSISDSNTVSITDFIIDAGNDKTTYCAGVPIQLDSITSNYSGTQALMYLWQPSTGLNHSDIPNPVSTVNTSITYTVLVSTSNGCTATDYIDVFLVPLTVDAGTDSIYCGDSLQLSNLIINYNGNGTLSYQWSPQTGLDNDTIAQPTVYVNQDTKYYVTITTPEGCTAHDSILINYRQRPLKISSDNSNIVCGSSAKLTVSPRWVMMKNFEGGQINSIYFINADTGFAVGVVGLIIKTINGGKSWQVLNSNTTKQLNDIYFVNDTLGFAVGGQPYGIILKTTNAGDSWTSYTLGTSHTLNAVHFINTTTGYVVGGNIVNNYIIMKTTNSGNSWTTIKTGTNSNLKDVVFVNDNTGFAVGLNGLILKTENAGNSWDTQTSNTNEQLNSVIFLNPLTGYATTYASMLKTTDGGISWSLHPVGAPQGIYDMFFLNVDTGYICSFNQIMYTYNGCNTWDFEELPTTNTFKTLHFSPDGTGYAMGTNGILSKLEKPFSYEWSPAASLSDALNNSTLANPNTNTTYTAAVTFKNGCVSYDTVVVMVEALLLSMPLEHTISCGTSVPLDFNYINQSDTSVISYSWTPTQGLNNPLTANPLASPINTTTYTVEVTTNNGCSTDGSITVHVNPLVINAGTDQTITCGEVAQLALGTSWTTVSTNNHNFRDLYFTSADTGYAVYNGVYKTTNGGYSWQMISQQVGHQLQSVFFVDKQTGFAVGDDGIIMKTIDGQSWTMNWIYTTQLKSVFFTHADTGYVVGDGGIIRKTVDGGANWSVLNSGTTNNLRDLFFISSDIGFAVGENATFLKTTDGGANWISQTVIGSNNWLNAVYFVDADNGYISGNVSVFLKTTDGGSNWTLLPANWFEGKSMYFSDVNNGYVAGIMGAEGGIGRTTDGGSSWSLTSYNNISSMYGMHFPSANIGYVLGSGMGSYVVMKLPAPPDILNWHPSIGLNDTTIANPIANPLSSTTYYVNTLSGQCPASDSVVVYVNPLTVDAGQNVWDSLLVCKAIIHLDSVTTNYNGAANLTYQWAPATGLDSDTVKNPTADIMSSTTYYLTVTTPNGCQATDSIYLHIYPLTVNTGSDIQAHCGEMIQLDSVVTNYYGTDTLFYQWSPASNLSSDTVPNPQIVASNITYTLTVNNSICQGVDELVISLSPEDAIPICIVSVDSNNRNIIVWEKPQIGAIDSFYVFRETNITGVFEKIASVPYDSMSVFVDNNSQPQVHSNRYKLSMVDSCGLETVQSPHHKTMHLTINQGMGNTWNLIWETYEGFTINTYNIYRGTHPDSLFQIGTMAGVNTQYSDVNAPSGFVYYQVEIIGNWCSPSKAYNFSRSNIATNDPNSTFFQKQEHILYNLFPNPVEREFFIEPSSDITAIKISNELGQIVKEKYCCFEKGISCNDLKPGLYTVSITTKNTTSILKFIKY